MRIIDKTLYEKDDVERKPELIEFVEEQTGRSFMIRRDSCYANTWFLTCGDLCERVDLRTDDMALAVKKALHHLKKLADEEIRGLSVLVNDIDNLLSKNLKNEAALQHPEIY